MFANHTLNTIIQRLLVYALLSSFGLFMIFPFLYMAFTSLKTSSDVFRYPPQLFPLSQEMVEYQGEMRPAFLFTVDGVERHMVSAGERVRFGFFTTPELYNADTPRSSQIMQQAPIDDLSESEQTVTVRKADGSEETLPIWFVPVEGEADPQPFVLAYRGALDRFIDPDEPEISTFAVERTAPRAEFIDFQLQNYNAVMGLNLDRALFNTVIVTLSVVAGQLITSIFGGYAFSRVEFKGRDMLFVLYLGSIMIPFVVLIIPMYRLMVILEWQNRIVSLIVPWIFTAYGTFLMRQFFLSIPKEIEEAALLDGASRFRILWGIFVPLSKPAIATLAIFSFLYAWNSFLWPLLIIGEGNEANHVLTLSLIRLSNSFADQPNMVLTGAAIAILPPMLVFIFAQRYFIEGVASSGVKG